MEWAGWLTARCNASPLQALFGPRKRTAEEDSDALMEAGLPAQEDSTGTDSHGPKPGAILPALPPHFKTLASLLPPKLAAVPVVGRAGQRADQLWVAAGMWLQQRPLLRALLGFYMLFIHTLAIACFTV